MSDVPIDLDTTDLFSSDHYTVSVSSEPYDECKLFTTKIYKVKYKDDIEFPYEMFLYLSKRPFGTVFTMRTEKVIDTVQVYYNISNGEDPLVVGFYAAYEKKYFAYATLKEAKVLKFSTENFIDKSNLLTRLVEENNKINKKLKFTVSKFRNNINVNELRSKLDNFSQIIYTPQQDQRRESVLYFNFMLKLRINNDITQDKRDHIHNVSYDAVVVYYSTRYVNIKVPLVVEFINDGKSYYFSRLTDETETYWRQFEIHNPTKLEELKYILRSTDRLITFEDKSELSKFGDGKIREFYEMYPTLFKEEKTNSLNSKDIEKNDEHVESESSGSTHVEIVDLKPKSSHHMAVSLLVGTLGLSCGIGAAFLLFKYYHVPEIKMERFY